MRAFELCVFLHLVNSIGSTTNSAHTQQSVACLAHIVNIVIMSVNQGNQATVLVVLAHSRRDLFNVFDVWIWADRGHFRDHFGERIDQKE